MTLGGCACTARISTWLWLEFDVMRAVIKKKCQSILPSHLPPLPPSFYLFSQKDGEYLHPPECWSKCSPLEWMLPHNKSQRPQQQKNKVFFSLPASPPASPHRFPDRPPVLPLGWETGLYVCGAKPDSAGCQHRNSAETREPASLSPASWCLRPVWRERDKKQVENRAMPLTREGRQEKALISRPGGQVRWHLHPLRLMWGSGGVCWGRAVWKHWGTALLTLQRSQQVVYTSWRKVNSLPLALGRNEMILLGGKGNREWKLRGSVWNSTV